MKTGTGGARALIGAAVMVLALTGCGGGGGSDSGGPSDPGPGAIKSTDYWYEDPGTVAVFARSAWYRPDADEIIRMLPIGEQASADGPAAAWIVHMMGPSGNYAQLLHWMHAAVRADGIHVSTTSDPASMGPFELELPATFMPGQAREQTGPGYVYHQERAYPAQVTVSTRATRVASLALTRFTVKDLLKVEQQYRYVLTDDATGTNTAFVSRDSFWYGRGLGLVRSELGGTVPEGNPVPLEYVTELRGLQSPTRAVGALPVVAAVDRQSFDRAAAVATGTDPGIEDSPGYSSYAHDQKLAGGTSGFMLAAAFSTSIGRLDSQRLGSRGVLVATADDAGHLVTLRLHDLSYQLDLYQREGSHRVYGLAFGGPQYWLLGARSTPVGEDGYLVRIAGNGDLLDSIDPARLAGCAIVPSDLTSIASNHQSVVIADLQTEYVQVQPDPLGPIESVTRGWFRWCAFDAHGQFLVDGASALLDQQTVERASRHARVAVAENGNYIVSAPITDPPREPTQYVEIALDPYGNALDAAPRMVAGSAPAHFGRPAQDAWPSIVDLGRSASVASRIPAPGVAASGSGTLAIIHESGSGESAGDALVSWSLVVPAKEAW